MEPVCHLAVLLISPIASLLIQVHLENADLRCSGHSSGRFELHACYFLLLYFLHVEEVFRVERKFEDSEAAFPDSC